MLCSPPQKTFAVASRSGAVMAARFLLQRLPLSHLRKLNLPALPTIAAFSPFLRRHSSSPVEPSSHSSPNDDDVWSAELGGRAFGSGEAENNEDWSAKKSEILKDIEGTLKLAKEILHSGRYECGDTLSSDDEKEVVAKLLAYHPHHEDKIGCGMDSIMVDYHPVYRSSRCLFVVRVDCSAEDFSYRKCLASYIRHKYPSDAERFISSRLGKPGRLS